MRPALRIPLLSTAAATGAAALGWSVWSRTDPLRKAPDSYKVIAEENGFEVRTYKPSIVAITDVECPYEEAMETAFKRLCHYLNGENETGGQFSLSAPIFQEKLAGDTCRWRMTFTLREHHEFSMYPRPLDKRIELMPLGIRTCAALAFTGPVTEELMMQKEQELLERIGQSTWRVTGGEPVLAEYQRRLAMKLVKRHEILIAVGR